MALQPKIIACGNSVATFAMAIRFLTGPAVMAAASIAVGVRGTLLHIAIVQVFTLLKTCVEHFLFFCRRLSFSDTNTTTTLLIYIGRASTRNCSIRVCEGVQCSSCHS